MKTIKKWSIWKAGLDPVVGSEQGKTRPVLVISETEINKILRVINVLPLTSCKRGRTIYPNEALLKSKQFGLEKNSIVLCYQIRTLDKKRLLSEYGVIDDPDKQTEIIESLCFQLGIGRLGVSN